MINYTLSSSVVLVHRLKSVLQDLNTCLTLESVCLIKLADTQVTLVSEGELSLTFLAEA